MMSTSQSASRLRRGRQLGLLIGILSIALFAGSTASWAHYMVPGDENGPPANARWYFTGMTYDGRPPGGTPRDFVNIMFYGAADTSPYTRSRIETHMNDDWNTGLVGGLPWNKDDEIWGKCKEDQYVGWPSYTGAYDSDKSDWHGSTSRHAVIITPVGAVAKAACFSQHHVRMWDDVEHSRVTTGHTLNDWAIGAFHHEKVRVRFPQGPGHAIDRDWDQVREEFVRGMSAHCSIAAWRYHPGADGPSQNYDSFGYIARISLRHRSQGCTGA